MTVCDRIWRYTIGHYGGIYVDVPAEHLDSFKKMFPRAQIPKRVKLQSVQETMTPYGEERFHREFPRSMGRYAQVRFADRSRGLKTLETLLDRCPSEQRAKKYEG